MTTAIEEYHIQAVTSWEGLQKLRQDWEKHQWHPGADFEFYQLVIQSRRPLCSPCVFVVFKCDIIIALLVGRIEKAEILMRFGYAIIGSLNVRKLVLIEGGFMGSRTDVIWTHLLNFIAVYLAKQNLDLASLENLGLNSFQHVVAKKNFGRNQLCPANAAEHWLLQLPKTFDEFMASRSKKRRYWLNRLPRILDRDFPNEWQIVCYRSIAEASLFSEAAETIARKTYHRGLGVGFKSNDETIRRITMEAQRNQLCSYVLHIRNEPKAFWYCFRYGKTLYLAATGYDPVYRSYEIGTILLMKVFRDHCNAETEKVDFGLGDAEYKQRFGTEHFPEATFWLFPNTAKGLYLNIVNSLTLFLNRSARSLLDRFNITQSLKTFLRRGKLPSANEANTNAVKDLDDIKGPSV